ncbi:MAG: diaminopimelate epimerase [Clostridia bacterium]|nr:diaminopimelate epimerase [Clostridia bacterium]
MRFTKMHGIGNDFIIIDAIRQYVSDPESLAARWCDRHFGIGADGLILALPSALADAKMRIFNSDGSEPEMCGNGIRCLAKFLYDSGLCQKLQMTVETAAGPMALTLDAAGARARRVTVNMGRPRFSPREIPVASGSNALTLQVEGQALRFFCVGMGNPHAVTFDLYPDRDALARLGPQLERHPAFPRGANVEFCRLDGSGGVDVAVWERGAGATLACGTGACAVLAAAASQGLLPRRATVRLPGGALSIRWGEDGCLYMTGEAQTVFEGTIPA